MKHLRRNQCTRSSVVKKTVLKARGVATTFTDTVALVALNQGDVQDVNCVWHKSCVLLQVV